MMIIIPLPVSDVNIPSNCYTNKFTNSVSKAVPLGLVLFCLPIRCRVAEKSIHYQCLSDPYFNLAMLIFCKSIFNGVGEQFIGDEPNGYGAAMFNKSLKKSNPLLLLENIRGFIGN